MYVQLSTEGGHLQWECCRQRCERMCYCINFIVYHLLLGMTGEAITGSWLNRTKSPFPSLLHTVCSEAGWFRVINPVISHTHTNTHARMHTHTYTHNTHTPLARIAPFSPHLQICSLFLLIDANIYLKD